MIEGVVGLFGEGKSYYAALRAQEKLAAGGEVLTNFPCQGCLIARSWDDVLGFREGLIVIDECNLWAPSRKWQSLDERLLAFWAQGRKYGTDMIWTSQHENRVDKVMRELTSIIYTTGRRGRFIMLRSWEPETFRKQRARSMGTRLLYQKQAIFDAYDSWLPVELEEKMGVDPLPVKAHEEYERIHFIIPSRAAGTGLRR